jgi:predicted Zn-dependent peptidase
VGGDLNAFTNKEGTVYYAAVLKDHINRAVDILTDIVFHSVYPQAEIDKEVEVICDEIESYNDSPAELIYDEFENIVFKGHPLGHNILGKAEQVRQFKTEDALRFTHQYYRPERVIFFIYGDVDFKRVIKLLEKYTADFPEQKPFIEPEKEPLPLRHQPGKYIYDKGTHQAHVMIGNQGYAIHDQRRMPLYLLNNILGGPGMNAKLNLALREHNGLVYTVESSMVSYGDTGLWCTYFGCDPNDVNRCLRIVRRELKKFTDKPLSQHQLQAAKKQIKGQVGVACDNRENFAIDFGKSFLYYGWEKDITNLYAQIEAITAEQIQAVAQEIFDENKMTTLIFK